ncbi:MAG: transcription antitermination factor NusB [Coriobacteriaceae bacterium]|nr:transcription antitermination factor NusB [Coriobacteriaceae bacterium]
MTSRSPVSSAADLSPARSLALRLLLDAEREGAFVRELMNHAPAMRRLDPRDAGLTSRLVLGVTAAQGQLDDLLNLFVEKPSRMRSAVRTALRISAFELVYLGTPEYVAISQGVLLSQRAKSGTAGFANAVLRKVAAAREPWLAAEDAAGEQRAIVSAARRCGLPVWLAREMETGLGERARACFDSQLEPAPLAFAAAPDFAVSDEVACAPISPALPGAFEPKDSRTFINGHWLEDARAVASDLSAQLIAAAATDAGPCLEIGAGRGTKTFTILSQAARAGLEHGRIHVAVDLFERKCAQSRERLERAHLPLPVFAAGDARDLSDVLCRVGAPGAGEYATVFLDAPCSGTGTMRRHPEIPWRLGRREIREQIAPLQLELLCEAARFVAPGGQLLYATCSVLSCENADVVDAFLASGAGSRFELAPLHEADLLCRDAFSSARSFAALSEDARGCFQSAPAPGAFDGHFCARFIARS